MASSLPTPPPRSSSSSIPLRIPINPPRPSPASVTSATARGTTTSTTSTPDVPPPPSITGSTATGTTATSTTISGVSSTSSPPSIFPPLVNNHQPAAPIPPTPHQPLLHHAPPRRLGAGASHPPQSGAGSRNSLPPSRISTTSMATQPIISTQREIDEARQAVVASLGNMLDRELSGRAAQLHANNSAIEKQEKEMSKTLEGFRKDNDRLAKLAAEGTKKIKEIGNVQNWAEMLERDFLIVEETLKLVGEGSWSGSESWSGSGSGSEDGEGGGERRAAEDGDVDMGVGDHDEGEDADKGATIVGKGKGKEKEGEIETALAEAMGMGLDIGAESSSRIFESNDTSDGYGAAGTDIKAAELQTTGIIAPETVALPPSPVGSVPGSSISAVA